MKLVISNLFLTGEHNSRGAVKVAQLLKLKDE